MGNGDINEERETTPKKLAQNERTILALVESPSFEGPLTVRLVEQRIVHQRRYVLHCSKAVPLHENEAGLLLGLCGGHLQGIEESLLSADERVAAERYLMTPLAWLREVPPEEAECLIRASRDDTVSNVDKIGVVLDGTTYELSILWAEQPLKIEWWGEPPAKNAILRKVVTTLLKRADLKKERRKCFDGTDRVRLMSKLAYSLDRAEERATQERKMALMRANEETHRIATLLKVQAITCPHCNRRSRDVRYLDKRPEGRSYFICRKCGRSFRVEDLAF